MHARRPPSGRARSSRVPRSGPRRSRRRRWTGRGRPPCPSLPGPAPRRRNGWASCATASPSMTSPPFSTTRLATGPSAVHRDVDPAAALVVHDRVVYQVVGHPARPARGSRSPTRRPGSRTARPSRLARGDRLGAGGERGHGHGVQRHRDSAMEVPVLRPGEREQPVEQPVHAVKLAVERLVRHRHRRGTSATAWRAPRPAPPASWPAACAARCAAFAANRRCAANEPSSRSSSPSMVSDRSLSSSRGSPQCGQPRVQAVGGDPPGGRRHRPAAGAARARRRPSRRPSETAVMTTSAIADLGHQQADLRAFTRLVTAASWRLQLRDPALRPASAEADPDPVTRHAHRVGVDGLRRSASRIPRRRSPAGRGSITTYSFAPYTDGQPHPRGPGAAVVPSGQHAPLRPNSEITTSVRPVLAPPAA